jgi:hypothetical protein
LLLAGHVDEAGQYAAQALDLARRHKVRGEEVHALFQLGAVQAHAALSTAIALYRTMDVMFWLRQAKDALGSGR